MANLNVAMLGPKGYAKELGKMGTSTDITFYNLKRGDDTVTLVEPSRYPERLSSLFFAVSMAKKALLIVEEIDAAFGECTIMLHCARVKEGYIILKNYLTPEQLEPLIKGTLLENYQFVEDDPIALREKLLEDAASLNEKPPSDKKTYSGMIPIDHFFNVRGIGTVVLGSMAQGTIKKHDNLKVLPGDKTAQVRSIQKHDDDFDWAVQGDRAGLALKNIETDELDRGFVLTNDESIKTESDITAQAELIRYWPTPIKEGMILHVGHWMQLIAARVISVKDEGDWHQPTLDLKLEKELVFMPGDEAVVNYLDGGKLRVAGTIQLP